MLQLHSRMPNRWLAEPIIVRVSTNPSATGMPRQALLMTNHQQEVPDGFDVGISIGLGEEGAIEISKSPRVCQLPHSMSYLADGDLLRISPSSGDVSVLYRRNSPSNSMLVTERCNSRCIMCSQPPKDADDGYLVDIYLEAIPMMDSATRELGITGGEPTLLGSKFLALLTACKNYLPSTALHILSNGRLFNYLSLCQAVASIQHSDLMIGIPLYSDIPSRHDFIVQAQGAFDQTIRGLMNLERCGVRTEVRIVLEQQTVDRLSHLAYFIVRNLPFVDHVALMGLEPIGFARTNLDAIWIDPADYQPELGLAVRTLATHGIQTSIYNHQLCTLDRELWQFARRSISDWKNEYAKECAVCEVRASCGGFFSSGQLRRSAHIKPLLARDDRDV